MDDDLYCFTSPKESGVIYKKLPNKTTKHILDLIRDKNLIFDDELQEKIIELYGSMDIYSQRN